jgi:murein DD-endopeptidase MepM/ murein hydrolase activator NlpD
MLLAFFVWFGHTMVSSYFYDSALASKDLTLVEVHDAYDQRIASYQEMHVELQGKLEESEHQFSSVMKQLESKYTELRNTSGDSVALQSRLEAIKRRLVEVTSQRDNALKNSDKLEVLLEKQGFSLNEKDGRVSEMETALEILSRELKLTANERDNVVNKEKFLKKENFKLAGDLEALRDHQDKILTQLESAVKNSVPKIHKIVRKTGIDVNKLVRIIEKSYQGSGGPFITDSTATLFLLDTPMSEYRVSKILENFRKLDTFRIALENMPLKTPVRQRFNLTSGFGRRTDPVNNRSAFHKGVDLASVKGTPVYAPSDGTVIMVSIQRGYGKVIKIRHALGFETVYGHLDSFNVKVGQKVHGGDHIGNMGNTGRSTGSHLHYEILYNKVAMNPWKFMKAGRYVY